MCANLQAKNEKNKIKNKSKFNLYLQRN